MSEMNEWHAFWHDPTPGNQPADYLAADRCRSNLVVELVTGSAGSHASSILEIGCNAGRNLAALYASGFHDLTGVEINTDALALLRTTFHELDQVPVYGGSAATVLPTLHPCDIVVTLAVLEHVHPAEATAVFAEVSRLGRRLLLIEPSPPGHESDRQHPYDVPAIFTIELGRDLLAAVPVHEVCLDPDLVDYTAWLFE